MNKYVITLKLNLPCDKTTRYTQQLLIVVGARIIIEMMMRLQYKTSLCVYERIEENIGELYW